MFKNQHGFAHALVALVIVFSAIGAAGFLVFRRINTPQGPAGLACPPKNQTLSYSPVAYDDISTIIPLGNLAPPGHVLPTTHMYYNYLHIGEAGNKHSVSTKLYVPADMVATKMLKIVTTNSQLTYDAYRIDFTICKQVSGYFILVENPIERLMSAYLSGRDIGGGNKEISVSLKAGEQIGVGGGRPGAPSGVDFTIIDKRQPKPIVANPSRWPDQELYYSCSLDYFNNDLSKKLYAKIGDFNLDILDPGEPQCGTVYQDEIGSAQGVWVTRDVGEQQLWDTKNTAALVHSNFNHKRGAFSFGDRIKEIGINSQEVLYFDSTSTGRRNLDFKLVKSPGVYCYDTEFGHSSLSESPAILVQLVDAQTIRIASSAQACNSSDYKLSKYVEYIR